MQLAIGGIIRVQLDRLLQGDRSFIATTVDSLRPAKNKIAVGHRFELDGSGGKFTRLLVPVTRWHTPGSTPSREASP